MTPLHDNLEEGLKSYRKLFFSSKNGVQGQVESIHHMIR